MSNFQTILLAIFASVFVIAVLIFADVIKIGGQDTSSSLQGKVVIWGTFDKSAIQDSINSITGKNDELNISYMKKSPDTYQQELIEAFANGKGPDLFIIDPGMMKRNANFIYKIPYDNYPQKTFKDNYIEGAQIYMDQEGIVGFPLYVDPLVLYYNKDILTNAGIINPPTNWSQLFELNNTLTKRDNSGKIDQSMIALGQFTNINNAKDILATLLIQNNDNLVKKEITKSQSTTSSTYKTVYTSILGDNPSNYNVSPAEAVLKFFLEFSNVSKSAYSWNKALDNSLDVFVSGRLAFYLGRASELFKIESMNPNLSFDVARIPQAEGSQVNKTFGEIYAIVINKKSSNTTSAFSVASTLSTEDNAKNISTSLSLPPVLKSLLSKKPTDNAYLYTFFDSAVISRSWIDPDKNQTNEIFRNMVENTLSNSMSASQSISKASNELGILLK